MRQLDLFAGIGGITLAAEWAGIETVAFCEKEPFAQSILRKRFPGRPIYSDIFDLTKEVLERDGVTGIDIVSGGFPCQPFSNAGKRSGTDDDRYLWPEMCRLIGELRPSWVFAENVDGLVSMAQSRGGLSWKTKQQYALKRKWSSKQSGKTSKTLGINPSQLLFQLAVSVHRTGDTESSFWASPQRRDYVSGDVPGSPRALRKQEQGWSLNLNDQVRLWTTPNAADAVGTHGGGQSRSLRTDIAEVKQGLWPTPRANDAVKVGNIANDPRNGLPAAVLWPTPTASIRGDCPSERERRTPGLQSAVKMWPTPRAGDGDHGGPNSRDSKGNYALSGAVHHVNVPFAVTTDNIPKLWPSPTVNDSKNATLPPSQGKRHQLIGALIREGYQGQLNPEWVESLMNFPIGWTDGE